MDFTTYAMYALFVVGGIALKHYFPNLLLGAPNLPAPAAKPADTVLNDLKAEFAALKDAVIAALKAKA